MTVSPELAKEFYAAKRAQQLQAADDAQAIREYLLDCLDHNLIPDIEDVMIVSGKRAAPYGPFPSHRILMQIYEHELCLTPATNGATS